MLVPIKRIHGDEEALLEQVPRNSFDAVVSCLSLHWVNDLPGAQSYDVAETLAYEPHYRGTDSDQRGSQARWRLYWRHVRRRNALRAAVSKVSKALSPPHIHFCSGPRFSSRRMSGRVESPQGYRL